LFFFSCVGVFCSSIFHRRSSIASMFPLELAFEQSWPAAEWADVTVVAAVSGGPDSVALLRAMAALKTGGKGRLFAAHLNHQLRPEAAEDERFVVELCRRLNVPCEVEHAAVESLAAAEGDGIEAAARAARYRFLEKTACRLGARFVAVAHTADDQAETILHRILRGAGVRGLAGMSRARPLGPVTLLRPLLNARHADLLQYLDAIRQPYRTDQSNADLRYMRNRLRHDLLPRLQRQYNPDVVDALLRLGNLAGQSQAIMDDLVESQFDRVVAIASADDATIDLDGLKALRPYLVRELLASLWRRQRWPMQAMGMRQWDELQAMATSDAPAQTDSSVTAMKRIFPGGIAVEITGRKMRLRK
jgi:tRNA(Ile)-lysidine synthase